MSKLPILEGVLRYIRENNIPFAMPGHKKGRGFFNTPIGREFATNLLNFDITEVEGVDNLHNAEGIIKESSELLSSFYGSKKSYFLVNGSTSGNLAMIFSSFNEGDKVLVERNCHRSIFNAIIMRKLKPIYIQNVISERLNAPLSIDLEHFLKVLDNNKDAKGIIITYPNYYGICTNLEYIINIAKKYKIKVLVDSAHGCHFGVHKELPESAVRLGADMVVMSAHKTLSSLTQTAYLHINNGQDIEKADFYVSSFSSTSPSYMFLCAMDYARFYLERYGLKEYERLISICNYYKNKINEINGIYIVNKEDIDNFNREIVDKRYKASGNFSNHIKTIWNIDTTRYVINLERGYSGHLLSKYLRQLGVQAEMSDSSNVVLIFSPFNEEYEFKRLYEVLKTCDLSKLKQKNLSLLDYNIPEMVMLPFEVMSKEKTHIDLKDCLGRISASSIVPYPPGIPILTVGELIDKDSLEVINYYKNSGIDVLGLKNDKIEVIDN